MRKSKAEYQKKCKIKTVTFYTNKEDQLLYKYASQINFQKCVKIHLRNLIEKYYGTIENYEEFIKEIENGIIQEN